MPGTLAGKGSQVCRPYGQTHHPNGDEDQGDRTGTGRHARKQAAERLGVGVGAVRNWGKAYREGGMAALQPRNRNASQANKPAPRRSRNARAVGDDVESLRRRVEELENAVMREVVETRRKRPRRRSAAPVEQGEDAAGRPVEAGVFARLDDMLARVSRQAATYCHHARLGVDEYAGLRTEVAEAFAASKGGYGYRRIKAMLRTGVSKKVIRRIMAEDGVRLSRALGGVYP